MFTKKLCNYKYDFHKKQVYLLVLNINTIVEPFTVIRLPLSINKMCCQLYRLNGTDRRTYMDGFLICSSLTLEHDEHPKTRVVVS
jgi:hypothetical protein